MEVERTLAFPVPPEALWPWLCEPERLARWIRDAERFEARPPGALAAGSRLVVHVPRGVPIEARVRRLEPARALVLVASGLPNELEVELSFLLEPQGTGSRLVVRAQAELSGLMLFAERMIAAKAEAKLAGWTETLRGLVVAV